MMRGREQRLPARLRRVDCLSQLCEVLQCLQPDLFLLDAPVSDDKKHLRIRACASGCGLLLLQGRLLFVFCARLRRGHGASADVLQRLACAKLTEQLSLQ